MTIRKARHDGGYIIYSLVNGNLDDRKMLKGVRE